METLNTKTDSATWKVVLELKNEKRINDKQCISSVIYVYYYYY